MAASSAAGDAERHGSDALDLLVARLEQLLAEQGHKFNHGASIAAANEAYR